MGESEPECTGAATPAPPEAMGPSGRSTLRHIATEHPAQVVAVAGGLGYLIGYLNVRAATAGLRVSPGDLALTTNDQLVMAAFWGLLVVVILAFVWGLGMRAARGYYLRVSGGPEPALYRAFVGVAGGLIFAAFFTVVFAHSVRWTINSVALVAVVAGLGFWLGGLDAAGAAALCVGLLLGGPPLSYRWGTELREHAERNPPAPVWLGLVIARQEGLVELPSGTGCAIRVSDRVYVMRTTLRIEPSAAPFTKTRCFAER